MLLHQRGNMSILQLFVPVTLLLISLSVNHFANAAQLATTGEKQSLEYHAEALISWLKSEKGFFSSKIEMRREDPSDPTSRFGMFAKEDIAPKTLLIRIPRTMLLDSGTEEPEFSAMECGTVRNLIDHLQLRNESQYAPYVNYLLDTQPPGQLPSAWSQAGKDLLEQMLIGEVDDADDESTVLPPMHSVDWIEGSWIEDCEGTHDALEEYAALLVIQRNWDDLLIPLFDMMNHRNGRWYNTESNDVHDGKPIRIKASRTILKGEEVYNSYNMCGDCGGRMTQYGTPEILRDYGFVEDYPQTWIFSDIDVSFRMDEIYDDNDKATGDYEVVEWIGDEDPDGEDMFMLKELLEQLRESKESHLASRDENVPEHEWDTIKEFFDAMELAMQTALWSFKEQFAGEDCRENGTCRVSSMRRYTDLQNREFLYWDEVGDEWPTCDEANLHYVFDSEKYEIVEKIKSPYQEMTFRVNTENKDTCFDLENVLQICDNYRPYYHELSVHNAARWLPNGIKRVLWVGGGDSMLLHEFLKYPSVELIVGLEIDQIVTRASFKHFGTQPHFDDDRVEWWFGDATKSLVMLPKEYFGSFDMVVVDLSETVTSLSVTDELNVMDALTLLIKPDGIFVKNEYYFGHFKDIFPHSVMMHWYDNPVICSQVMVFGSWNIDFMDKSLLTDHHIDAFLMEPLESMENPYELYHDYAHNYTFHHLCDIMLDKTDIDEEQKSSPGIILIVEVEDSKIDLGNPTAFKETVANALSKEGLTVISAEATDSETGIIASFMMQEGYVVARTGTKDNYCGFDIHFWTALDKHESTKDALVMAVGSTRSAPITSFRVIAGGMFGLSSWKSDEKIRGLQYEEICEKAIQKGEVDLNKLKKSPDISHLDIADSAIAQSISLLSAQKDIKVMMLIGDDDNANDYERNVKLLEKMGSIATVETINCPSMQGFNEYADYTQEKESGSVVSDCELSLKTTMLELSEDEPFDVLLIDSSADPLTASIMLKTFSGKRSKLKQSFFSTDALVVSTIDDDDDGNWLKNFFQVFKDEVFYWDPACYAEVVVTGDNGAVRLLLGNKADKGFIQKVTAMLKDFEEKDLSAEIQLIDGAEFYMQDEDDYGQTQRFVPADFDQGPSLEQWNSQKPLGHQVIFQMHWSPRSSKTSPPTFSKNHVREALFNALSESEIEGIDFAIDNVIEHSDVKGDGVVMSSIWSGGSIIVLWDGRRHVDVNLFIFDEDDSGLDSFEEDFTSGNDLKRQLRDEQPRGSGRVVSYASDLASDPVPHWAP